MSTIKVPLISIAIFIFSSTNLHAKIYPDQLIIDTLGEDICRSEYRPINRFEAVNTRLSVARMANGKLLDLTQLGDYGPRLLWKN